MEKFEFAELEAQLDERMLGRAPITLSKVPMDGDGRPNVRPMPILKSEAYPKARLLANL